MSDQYSAILCCHCQYLWIVYARKSCCYGSLKIYTRFSPYCSQYDGVV